MKIFKTIKSTIRLRQLTKMVRELCGERQTCRNCPAYIPYSCGVCRGCALSATLELALDKWGMEEEVSDNEVQGM